MNFWSGLNDLKDISSDTDSGEDVNKEENNQKKLKSNTIIVILELNFTSYFGFVRKIISQFTNQYNSM